MKLPQTALALFLTLLMGSALTAKEVINASAAPPVLQVTPAQTIDVPVNIDLSALPEALGSFTARVRWDAEMLRFDGYTGGQTPAFANPIVNDRHAAAGEITFAHANPQGARGAVNVLNLRFTVIGAEGTTGDISLYFTAMSAAGTFTDLLPYLAAPKDFTHQLTVVREKQKYELESFPNPFNPTTQISYALPQAGNVNITIYNVLGQKVRVLVNQKQPAGKYSVQWDSTNDAGKVVPTGMYFLRMQVGTFLAERKLLLMK